jgi:serine/threonine protein kinase/tetratricopeptide (TPR) repeat protein
LSVGPFELLEPVARGGMAQVWRGVHRGRPGDPGVPVAIKVVHAPDAHRVEFERRFADEIRAVAALDHPGVVMVLDHGRIREGETDPRIEAGAPWLAMEWAGGGTLASQKGPMPWPMLKSVLLALLDALAHAHAHGVVHRDLKPQNVLIATRQDLRPGIKLSDFGIAFAGRDTEDGELVVGTPSYMAPEQIRGDWRDLGPWTDLYAFGCLTWWLCTGSPPFASGRPQQTMMAHLSGELPELRPRMPVPEGFLGWLRKLLEKRFPRRFQLAADAAWALATLPEPPVVEGDEVPELDPAFQDTVTHTDVSFGESWRLSLTDDAPVPHAPVEAPRPPPMPSSWRRPLPKPPPVQLVGAGLSLYGLRAVQLVDRDEERDLLWSELAEVVRSGRARVVLLHGPAGTGKSRLVEWLVKRANEVGAARWSKATFGAEQAPGQALQEMALAEWRTRGLKREDVERRVRGWLHRFASVDGKGVDEAEAGVLTELLCPATEADLARGVKAVRLQTAREYYVGTMNSMARVASLRPLITWFDDVQHGLHGLGVAREVLRAQDVRPFPCLLVLTMRSEALDDASDEARRLRKLLDTPGARSVPIGPLPPAAHRELVHDLLGLDEALAARVADRTGGNPLFAVQLVGSWVQDGTLEVTERGFQLKAGAGVELPDDLHAVWSAHVGRIVGEFPANAQEFLEVAACLGQEVRSDEWRRACDDPHGLFGDRFKGDEPLRTSLVDQLLSARLVVGTHARWSFVHGMLRESLERTAREAGRWRQHHEACAAMLKDRAVDPRVAERLGRHLLEAGQVEQALEPLLRGVEHRLTTVGPQPARALLATVAEAMRGLGLPESDPRWGRLGVLSARTLADTGELDQALETAHRARTAATRFGWADVAFVAAEAEARLTMRLGRLADAEALLQRLQAEAEQAGDRPRVGVVLVDRAEVARRRGEPLRVVEHLRRAVAALEGGSRLDLARAELEWGRAAAASGDAREATRRLGSALGAFETLGAALGAAECADRWGRVAAGAGDLDTAERMLTRALSQYEALGSERALACRMRLAQVVLRKDPARTWPIVERAEPWLAAMRRRRDPPADDRSGPSLSPSPAPRVDHRGRLAATFALKLVRRGLDRDWVGWDETFAEASAQAAHLAGSAGPAWLAWIAGEAAVRAGEVARGTAALQAAALLFRAAGDRALAEEVERSVPE